MSNDTNPLRLDRSRGAYVAYHKVDAAPARADPSSSGALSAGLVWLGGFRSDMEGSKALALDAWARETGRAYVRFDYQGHGVSSGDFIDGTIGSWKDDAIAVIDALTDGPQILVGSSMGGWIALLAALARPERVAGLILIAPAPDFTERLMWPAFSADVRATIERDGVYYEPSEYSDAPTPITLKLIEDGRRHLLYGNDPIAITCPVRIIQGLDDPDVPWRHALQLVDRLKSADIEFTRVTGGDHRLSTDSDLARLVRISATLAAAIDEAAEDPS